MTTAAGAHDQQLVLYYAASVFMSFLVSLLAMARFAYPECRHKSIVINLIGAIVVAFTLIVQHGKRSASLSTQRTTNTTPHRALSTRSSW